MNNEFAYIHDLYAMVVPRVSQVGSTLNVFVYTFGATLKSRVFRYILCSNND